MRRVATAFILGLLFLSLCAAPRASPGCSCSPSSPPVSGGGTVQPVPVPDPQVQAGSEARREVPPLYVPGTAPPKVKPMTLKDEQSGTVFYFETDGQHVTAFDKDGTVLWHKNPVEEAGLKGFSKEGKTVWPTIFYAGPTHEQGKRGKYLSLGFNTKDFGLLDKQTGAFTLVGRD